MRSRTIIGAAIAVALCALPAASASTRPANSFDGICRLSGTFQFAQPVGNGVVTTALTDTASGTCRGKLNGVERENIPVTNSVSGTATLVGCSLGSSSTADTLTFGRRTTIHILVDAGFATPEGAGVFRGARSGGGVVQVNLLPYTNLDVVRQCQAGTLRSAGYDVLARTVTPMVG